MGSKISYIENNLVLEELDEGIRFPVKLLNESGIKTYVSCEGGPEHLYHEPTIGFRGTRKAALYAVSLLQCNSIPVNYLRRVWEVSENATIHRAKWQIVLSSILWHEADEHTERERAGKNGKE